jgi:hypothetical protein
MACEPSPDLNDQQNKTERQQHARTPDIPTEHRITQSARLASEEESDERSSGTGSAYEHRWLAEVHPNHIVLSCNR